MRQKGEASMSREMKRRPQAAGGREKHIVSCNFRSAGRVSNEYARALTSIHEDFARNLSTALDAFLGTGLDVRLSTLDQLRFDEHIAAISDLACIVPFTDGSAGGVVLVECDSELIFPMIDLLLGGAGSASSKHRELSEIEEEIVLDVFSLIIRQAEISWRLPGESLTAGKCAKPAMLEQYCAHSDKVTCVRFSMAIGETAGSFQFMFPHAFLNAILQQVRLSEPQKRATVRYFPRQGIRDRILESDVEVAVELPGLRIAVKDLLALIPGSVLKLRASVRTPGMLTAGGQGIFEATPVRNGSRRAAQLGRRVAAADQERV